MAALSRIYLRGVNLVNLVDRYLSGEFSELNEQIPIDKSIIQQQNQQLVTIQEAVKVLPNEVQLVAGKKFACLGHQAGKSGQYTRINPEQKEFYCMNCLRKFIGDQQNTWGIPICRKEINGIIRFFTIDIFCHPRCVLYVLNHREHNQIYSHSYSLFTEMFELKTGKKFQELSPLSDPRLLKRMNGPLTWEEYHKLSESYTSKPSNVVCIPVIEYIEQDS